MNKITYEINHKLSQDLIKKATEDPVEWYKEEIIKSNVEFRRSFERK